MLHRTSGCQLILPKVHVRRETAAAAAADDDGDGDQKSSILRRSPKTDPVIMTASFTAVETNQRCRMRCRAHNLVTGELCSCSWQNSNTIVAKESESMLICVSWS